MLDKLNLTATSAFGIESIVAHELKSLGYENLKIENGKIDFATSVESIPRCNLWLRSADRVFIKFGEFEALSFEELFEGTKALPWADFLPENACFPVEGKSIQSKLFSVSDCQAIVKKAIVEKMKMCYKKNWFTEDGPMYKIQVSLLKDTVNINIDTSGPGLHKRGYRSLSVDAPLKETLAAAMIQISRFKADRALIDPMCGSGTIPIEAALISRNIAPGINRNFASENWKSIPASLWKKARDEAYDLADHSQALGIMGFDLDKNALQLARYHAGQAGLKDDLYFQQQSVTDLKSKYKYGYLITNPPYGERLEDKQSVEKLYREMGKVFSSLDTWSHYIITSHPDFEKFFNRKADKKRKLYNGRIQCNYYQFFGPKPENLAGPFAKKTIGKNEL